ncbi:MAG TPA: hypothetical protein DEO70_14915 [Bacteroidales bacterium]|nr:MAG: hypothetical protein A2X11_09620 [Bacteroidetes bacterium GWE2_42_24]OFY27908.1 MAG: hypothetical protein A2X09_15240 [Bacteroidetes bacterium GWF2_43_11]PKP23381.1 MAG: hypothetical protein CVU06_08540 [Bacteroidetes bacterium HGW-Bacteroidetes-22]HBZ68122.1 hypothetical protein [Bacteroidales bacterium]
MSQINFKQAVYAAMVAVAGEDEEVTKQEQRRVDTVFDHFMKLGDKEKKGVMDIWKAKQKDEFTKFVVSELKAYPKPDQMEAYMRIAQYINYAKNEYNQSSNVKLENGVDKARIEITKYWDRANVIKEQLDFTAIEYNAFIQKK